MPATAVKIRQRKKPAYKLLTAEQYSRLVPYVPSELVRGNVVRLPPPFSIHGFVCSKADRILGNHVEARDSGTVLSNDAGVVTERNPDTVRGADIAFYGKAKDVGKYLKTRGNFPFPPDLVVEVKSADQPWKEVLRKVAEYLNAGVQVVIVLDYIRRTATVYEQDSPERTLKESAFLEIPSLLPKLKVKVAEFFG